MESRNARKEDVSLPGKGNPHLHGARPVHLIITMVWWIRTSRLSIKNSLSQNATWCFVLLNECALPAKLQLFVLPRPGLYPSPKIPVQNQNITVPEIRSWPGVVPEANRLRVSWPTNSLRVGWPPELSLSSNWPTLRLRVGWPTG